LKDIVAFLRPRNLSLMILAFPLILGAIYLFGIAADRYESHSIVSVRQSGSSGAGLEGLAMLLVPQAGSGRQDSLVLQEYLRSMDVLKLADQQLGLRKAYSEPAADFIFRLPKDAPQERFLAYFQSRVEVLFDDTTGLVTIRTQAFTPEMAFKLNDLLVRTGEKYINEVSHRLAREQLSFSEGELVKARKEVQSAKLALEAFQRDNGVLDPAAQAAGSTGLSVQLQAELSRKEAELQGLLGFVDPKALQITTLRDQISGLRAQLQTEARRALRAGSGRELNQLAIDYQSLSLTLQFAQEAYRLALTASESARIESIRKLRHVVLVESPVVPQAAEYPRRWYDLLVLALGLALFYGIARLVVATIEDHLE
jgi:capsular polysaccharide transport system permease protein